jgi:phosphoribosylformylglycinamidine synthase
MKVGVVTFPGSNCDYDAYAAIRHVMGHEVEFLWHKSTDLCRSDLVILPGGFSYGDYLRAGAIARFSPIMERVIEFARAGGLVLGICNGFQVLTECQLLPGALIRNQHLRFSCTQVYLRVERNSIPFTRGCMCGDVLKIPIAHAEGGYYNFEREIAKLENAGQVVFRYVNADGEVVPTANPNGSIGSIAGICNKEGNVLGMMPHPERAVETILGSSDGLKLFESVRASLSSQDMAGLN